MGTVSAILAYCLSFVVANVPLKNIFQFLYRCHQNLECICHEVKRPTSFLLHCYYVCVCFSIPYFNGKQSVVNAVKLDKMRKVVSVAR